MALAENPHRSPWWGFCFPAYRTSLQAPLHHRSRIGRLVYPERSDRCWHNAALLPKDCFSLAHQTYRTVIGAFMETIIDTYTELG